MKQTVLVAANIGAENTRLLSKHSNVITMEELSESDLVTSLPRIDCLLIFSWPKQLTADNLSSMTRLRFVQNILAGVNQVPFGSLPSRVFVASNAGAYSDEVAEYAVALLLSVAKRIVEVHTSIKNERWNLQRTMETGKTLVILKGKILGILGYGGIGRATGRIGKSFQMSIYGYGRREKQTRGVRLFRGKAGLSRILKKSDAVVLSLPLTVRTRGIIDRVALKTMKKDAILVNIARGELVDQKALYEHLKANPMFHYATDVWWYREEKETLHTDYPFMSLPNFVGTPHLSGPSGFATGKPVKLAVENLVRYLRGLRPRNIVNPSDYVNSLSAS
jgi:phosphoglycerate dehydrogenase-like enzyme